ncbi:hypothetical protein [Clostridium botulinum]|uniref:hypothetical protein n=1 Tax=Clostridium botulinum TaxID=1491 RepID=UPI001E475690|nr:hypothetical protein [Clostridium botulinum]MCD3223967.1 hypothetical protein [Clostridium botulinum C/D]MCD3298116.1 hypothetical protein [Clostridium botulinum C/D]
MRELLKEQATKLQKELNKRESGDFKYKVSSAYVDDKQCVGMLELQIKDNATKQSYNYITFNVCEDFESNIKNLIYKIFEYDINELKKIPQNFNAYKSNYMNSLEKAFENEDIHKIIDVNIKLLEQRKKVKELEEKIDYYMHFVRLLYKCRDQLCPSKN